MTITRAPRRRPAAFRSTVSGHLAPPTFNGMVVVLLLGCFVTGWLSWHTRNFEPITGNLLLVVLAQLNLIRERVQFRRGQVTGRGDLARAIIHAWEVSRDLPENYLSRQPWFNVTESRLPPDFKERMAAERAARREAARRAAATTKGDGYPTEGY